MYHLVDTHAHLEEITDLGPALAAARLAGVAAIVAVGSDEPSNAKVIDIARQYPDLVYPALGLHPNNLTDGSVEPAVAFIAQHLDQAVAIGEIGLDYHRRALGIASKERQQAILATLLKLAAEHGKPVLIHARYAWRDALNLVVEAHIERAVFHWFTGPASVLQGIADRGYYISATPAASYHEEHQRAVKGVPLDRLLLETDAPVTYRQNPDALFEARPADVRRSLAAAAALRSTTEEEIAAATTMNAVKLFGLRLE
jgi:TatD DNase family protein